ncbi:LysR family regulatory protein [Salmonella enterica subsp. enterica]|nr:LysR family regulatory protein [Salmonella enterica subsp. enterica]
MVGMLMAGPISLFRQRYPGVELKISEFGGLTVQQAVMNGELDVAMTALPVEEASGLTTLSLFSHPLVRAGSPFRSVDNRRLHRA